MARRGHTPRPPSPRSPRYGRVARGTLRGFSGGPVDATVATDIATVTFSAVGTGGSATISAAAAATVTFSARAAAVYTSTGANVEGHVGGSVGSGSGPQAPPATTTGAVTTISFDGATSTITRSSGSFLSDGFQVGDRIEVSGSASNDLGTLTIAAVTSTTITVEEPLLVDETSGATVTLSTIGTDFGGLDWYVQSVAPGFSIAADWQFIVCDANGVAIADVSRVTWGKRLSWRLDRSWFASARIPGDDPLRRILHTDGHPYISAGRRVLKCYRLESGRWVLRFAGRILQVEDDGDADETWTAFTAYDPWTTLYRRVVRNAGGSRATDVIFAAQAGNVLAKALVDRTIAYAGACGITTSSADCVFETTTNQELPLPQGTSVATALEMLCDTGLMDVYLRPVDRQDGILVEMNVYNSFGDERAEAAFAYPGTIERWRRLIDATELANDIDIFYGTRPAKAKDWKRSAHTDATSITAFGRWEDTRVFEGAKLGQAQSIGTLELALRRNPRETLSITPLPERAPLPFLEWFLGDEIPVSTDDSTGQALSGVQRVYGFTLEIDDDGFERITDISTSSNL